MNAARHIFFTALFAASLFLISAAPLPRQTPPTPLVANINATLKPGVLNAWRIGPSTANGGYIVEVNPWEDAVDGNYVETALVRPEFDGKDWNDILRVKLPDGMAELKANLRVYATSGLPVVMDFETRLEPGIWHGWIVAATSQSRAYVVKVTPQEPSITGAYFEKMRIQSEWNGVKWYDVLRLELPVEQPSLLVRVRVYELLQAPMVLELETWLQPGDWPGYLAGPNKMKGGYVVKVTQLDPPIPGSVIGKALVEPEFDGKSWNDVLRLSVAPDSGPMHLHVRVYQVMDKKASPKMITSWPKIP